MRRKQKKPLLLRILLRIIFLPVAILKAVDDMKTLDKILIVVGVFFFWFNLQMLDIFRSFGTLPETYAVAVVAATIGECGICGAITRAKIKTGAKAKEDPEKRESEDPETTDDEESEGVG
ncbi:MAG: hypothetical protein J6N19_15350 [Clostridium sp.]|nr:hypothetical protein [Clostridium sp.]